MELPDELFDEVLTRVPVKYLLRCRCVSKGWCSVIDNTNFVEKYLKESIERNRGGIIIEGSHFDDSVTKYLLADLESLEDSSAVIDIGEEVEGILNGAWVVNSDNGLVCLSSFGENIDSVFLLNPCTRKCKRLPIAGKEFLANNNLDMYCLCGFGYDCASDDYKVVLIGKRNSPSGIMAIVYSLKKDAWTPIPNVFSIENLIFSRSQVAFADGAVIWRGFDEKSMKSFFVGFHLGLEQFRKAECYNGGVRLMDMALKTCGAEEISADPVFRHFRWSRPLMYSKSLEKLLCEVNHKRFVWYDFRSKASEIVTIPGIPVEGFISNWYIDSLFPLS